MWNHRMYRVFWSQPNPIHTVEYSINREGPLWHPDIAIYSDIH